MTDIPPYIITDLSVADSLGTDRLLVLKRAVNTPSNSSFWTGYETTYFSRLDLEQGLPALPFESRILDSHAIVFGVYFLFLVLGGVFYQNKSKEFIGIGKSFINNNTLFQEFGDHNKSNGIVSVSVFLLGIVVLAIYLSQLLGGSYYLLNLGLFLQSSYTVLIVAMLLIFGLVLKSIVVMGSALIFQTAKTMGTYLSLNIISIQILGVLLFPVVVLGSFGYLLNTVWVLAFGALIIGFVFLYRLIRTFLLGVKQTNSQVFHIILYICALEILPILVAGKLLLKG
jgi:MFS family permease